MAEYKDRKFFATAAIGCPAAADLRQPCRQYFLLLIASVMAVRIVEFFAVIYIRDGDSVSIFELFHGAHKRAALGFGLAY